MKHFIGSIATLLLFAGCQKQPTLPTMPSEASLGSAKAWPPQIAGERQMIYKYWRDAPNEMNCKAPGTNCSVVSFLSDQDANVLRPVLEAISSGIQDSIVDAFSSHEEALATFMIQWDIDAVIGEQVIATTFASGGIDHLVLTSEAYADTCAYRLKFP